MAEPSTSTTPTSETSPPRTVFAVTGFGPFAGVSENPTDLVVRSVREEARGRRRELARAVVAAEVLRVSADDAARWVREDLERVALRLRRDDSAPPSRLVAVHLGVYASATSPTVRLESRAHNRADFRVPDADGRVLVRERITASTKEKFLGRGRARETEEERLETELPLVDVAARLNASAPSGCRWKATTTDDAGRYLCNYIYWHSLRACSRGAERREGETSKLSSLRRLLARRRGDGGRGERERKPPRRLKRHALFVHLPPAEVLPVEEQLEFVWRLLGVLSEVLEEAEEAEEEKD